MNLFPPCRDPANEKGGDHSDQFNCEYNNLIRRNQPRRIGARCAGKMHFEVFRDSWRFRDRRVISSVGLNLESEVIVADTINGVPLGGENPFCFVAKAKKGESGVIREVTDIKLSSIR